MRGVKLQENERIVHSERGSIVPHIMRIVAGAFLLIMPTFFFFPLVAFGNAGFFLAMIVSGIGAYLLIGASVKWKGSMCILTNKRIIQVRQRGIVDKQVTYASLKNVNDVAYRISGLLRTVTRTGEVRVVFSGVIPSMLFLNIKQPKVLHDIIVEMRSLPKRAQGDASATKFERVHVDV